MSPEKKPFQNPHIEKKEIGNIPIYFHYTVPNKIPKTAVAFTKLAKTEYRDQIAQKDGLNDHIASLQKLMEAFDVFFHEVFRRSPSSLEKNPSNDEEFTIDLLWQIRHILTHNGGIVDEKSKNRYETIIEKNHDKQILVDLPLKLELDEQFIIDDQNYQKARTCILNYIQKHVSPEDFNIIKNRGSVVIHQPKGSIPLPVHLGYIMVDVDEATKHNLEIDFDNMKINPPEGTKYNLGEERVILPNGSSFAAKYTSGAIPKSPHRANH